MKQATCHPDRPHLARGLCGACYKVAWRATTNNEKRTLSSRAWYVANKERKAETDRAWRAAHPDYSRGQYSARAEYFRSRYAVHKEEIAIRHKAYNLANRDKRAAAKRTWCAANPERPLAYNRSRRATKLGAEGSLTWAQWKAIQVAYAGRCAYCGKKPAALTQDHVIPLSRGGSHTPENIVPACRSCNSRKGARPAAKLPAKRLLL